mgnify:FL=1
MEFEQERYQPAKLARAFRVIASDRTISEWNRVNFIYNLKYTARHCPCIIPDTLLIGKLD